jgi:hypothetical protein
MSVDTNATIAEKDNNVIESVQDGKTELLRDVSSSATNSMKETTASHLNESRQNIAQPRTTLKPSEKCSFLTLTHFFHAKTQFSGRMDGTIQFALLFCCSSALESNPPL